MGNYELKISEKNKRAPRPKIEWSEEMLNNLKNKFPTTFNRVLAKELGVGFRTLIRKARELNIEKEPGFIDKRRPEIIKMAVANNHNPHKGKKGWTIPGSEKFQFKKGHVPPNKNNPALAEKIRTKRNETIRQERLRIKYGLPKKTKLKLVNY